MGRLGPLSYPRDLEWKALPAPHSFSSLGRELGGAYARCGSRHARELYSFFPLPGSRGKSKPCLQGVGAGHGQDLSGERVKGKVASSWKEFSSPAYDSYCPISPLKPPPPPGPLLPRVQIQIKIQPKAIELWWLSEMV